MKMELVSHAIPSQSSCPLGTLSHLASDEEESVMGGVDSIEIMSDDGDFLPWLVNTVTNTTIKSSPFGSQDAELANGDACLLTLASDLDFTPMFTTAPAPLAAASIDILSSSNYLDRDSDMVPFSSTDIMDAVDDIDNLVSPSLNVKRRLCFDLDPDHMDVVDSPIPSSPCIPTKRAPTTNSHLRDITNKKSSPKSQLKKRLQTPSFSHWNLQGVQNGAAANIFEPLFQSSIPMPSVRRTFSEFSPRGNERSFSPSSNEASLLVSSNLGANHVIPCHDSPKDAIKRITPVILTRVLSHEFSPLYSRVIIIDCRYPYEYEGGHVPGAINVSSLDEIDKALFSPVLADSKDTVVIFHCEFSSERAPRMALHVRNMDRVMNADNYPYLHYPQLYILEGGYKNFFLQFPSQCDPPHQYVPMRDLASRDELRYHQRLKFNDSQQNGKHRHKLRSASLGLAVRRAHSIALAHPVSAVSNFLRNRKGACSNAANRYVEILSSDAGDIFEDSNSILKAAENFLLAPTHDSSCLKFNTGSSQPPIDTVDSPIHPNEPPEANHYTAF